MRRFLPAAILFVWLVGCGVPEGQVAAPDTPPSEPPPTAGRVSAPNAIDCLNPTALTSMRDALLPDAVAALGLVSRAARLLQLRERGNVALVAASTNATASYENTIEEQRSEDGKRVTCESDVVLARPLAFSQEGLQHIATMTTREPTNEVVIATNYQSPEILVPEYSYLLQSPGWRQSFYDWCGENYAGNCRYAQAIDQVYRVEPNTEYLDSLRARARVRYEVLRTEQGEIVTRVVDRAWPADVPDALLSIDRERFTKRGELVETQPWCGFQGNEQGNGQPIYRTYPCLTAAQICDAPGAFPTARCVPPQ